MHGRDVLKEPERVLYVHIQYVRDVLALETYLQRLRVESCAVACGARNPDVREKVHLDASRSVPFARVTTSALHVETEATRRVPAHFRFRQLREQTPDRIQQPGVGRGVGAGRSSDRALVDVDHLVKMLDPRDRIVRPHRQPRVEEMPHERRQKRVGYQRALTAARYSGHAHKHPEGDSYIDVLQIVVPRTRDLEPVAVGPAARLRDFYPPAPREIVTGYRIRDVHKVLGGPHSHDGSAPDTRARSEIHHDVGGAHGVFIVLDDDHRVPEIPQASERVEQTVIIPVVQTD